MTHSRELKIFVVQSNFRTALTKNYVLIKIHYDMGKPYWFGISVQGSQSSHDKTLPHK